MEFWGVEVKSGEPLKVFPGDGMVLHLSQANLGELKKEKGNESICLFVNVDGKKFVLGTLFTDKLPQQQFDLVFDRDFELSHNWKSGNESESEEDIPLNLPNNVKHESKAKEEHKSAEAAKEKKSDAGWRSSGRAGRLRQRKVRSGAEAMFDGRQITCALVNDEDDEDDESDESDEETPQKVETSKKRPVESATKTAVPDKKAKVTSQKTDGKKGSVHVDTPYPAKPAGKTPANKPNQQTPKSGGSHSCTSCNRAFGSEKALESHSKAKHGGGK
ncbi:hypothetical protein DH2020_039991 [Rehmannia glutinosa]|uniref:C2H2-type domain-containing protein n=1 Tax=Rehmannia glutinosa TaxID=99300 RepID=A0ABR0UVI1_REHGL